MKMYYKLHLAIEFVLLVNLKKENSSVEDKTLISGFSPEGNHSTLFQIHCFLILLVTVINAICAIQNSCYIF